MIENISGFYTLIFILLTKVFNASLLFQIKTTPFTINLQFVESSMNSS